MSHPSSRPIDILLVEDNPGDARLVEVLLLEQAPLDFRFVWTESLAAAIAKVTQQRFDVALLDLSLPDSQGLETLTRLRAFAPMLPVVVLTGHNDDALAIQAVQQGAQDYMVKGLGSIDLLRRSIRYAIERAATEANLRRSESQFRAVFENAGLGVAMIDKDGRLFSLNPSLIEMLGPNSQNSPLLDVIHPDDRQSVIDPMWALLGGDRDSLRQELRLEPSMDHPIWVSMTMSLVRGADQAPQFAVALIENIGARKALEEQQRLAARVLEATSEGVFITDAEEHIIHVNPAFTRMTGFEPEDAEGKTPAILASGRHGADFFAAMWSSIKASGTWQGEIWNRRKTGELFAAWLDISAVRDEGGRVSNYVSVFSDITSRKETEEKLTHRAHHDPLTGLPNRALFLERLDHAIARAQRNQLLVGVLFLDLDHFKQINDSLGHLVGDALLQQVSERLIHTVRAEDTVARMGGDEFTLILEDITDFRDAAKVAQKILQQFSIPFELAGQPHRVTTSIGVSLYPADGDSVPALLREADEAMYASKKQGRDSFRFASPDLSEQAFEHQTLEDALGAALGNGQLEVYFQPIIELGTLRMVGAEALLRWLHPEIGLMVPRQFLPLANDTGLIKPIGQWAMRQAMTQGAHWIKAHPELRICVNVSKTELQDENFIAMIEGLLAESGLPPQSLDVEVSEGVAMEAAAATMQALHSLRTLGIHIALDDFGIGHTDFRTLHSMPVDVVKIAPDFIKGLNSGEDEGNLVRAAIAVARSMNIRVVAKGVETSAQFEFLRANHCNGAQGYLLSPPVPASGLEALLAGPITPKE